MKLARLPPLDERARIGDLRALSRWWISFRVDTGASITRKGTRYFNFSAEFETHEYYAAKGAIVRKILVLLAGVISVTGLISGGGVAAADNLTVQGCYDNAKSYASVAGHKHYPRGYPDGEWLTTTSNCADINVISLHDRFIRVCFDPSWGDPYCQNDYTFVDQQWTVVATQVANDTKFKLNFYEAYNSTGSYAA